MAKKKPQYSSKLAAKEARLERLKKHSFKPGQSGNPLGAKLHNPAVRALKNFTHETFREVLEVVLTGTYADLIAIIENPESSNLHVVVAKAFRDSVDTGNYSLVERIAERLLGKPPETIHITKKTDLRAIIASTDRTEIKKALSEIEDDV